MFSLVSIQEKGRSSFQNFKVKTEVLQARIQYTISDFMKCIIEKNESELPIPFHNPRCVADKVSIIIADPIAYTHHAIGGLNTDGFSSISHYLTASKISFKVRGV